MKFEDILMCVWQKLEKTLPEELLTEDAEERNRE